MPVFEILTLPCFLLLIAHRSPYFFGYPLRRPKGALDGLKDRTEVLMKRLLMLLVSAVLLCGSGTAIFAQTQNDAKQDTKNAAHSTKQVAKKTGKAVKKTTKKTVHAGAKKTRQGADKVEQKTKE
jgi:uncharacterized protein HemX